MTIRRLAKLPRLTSGKFKVQSLRLTEAENKRMKRAATKEGHSFNAWAVTVLNEAADRVLNPPTQPEERTSAENISEPLHA